MSARTLVVVTAGLSQPSSTRLLADRLASATVAALAARGVASVAVEVVEVRDHAQALVNNLLTGFPSGELTSVVERVRAADGLIAAAPIFSGSYSGLFKVFFDVLERDALAGMPVLVGATGGSARHSLALDHAFRPLFAYLRANVVPTAVYAASSDWGSGESDGEVALADRIVRAAGELAVAIVGREPASVADPFAEVTPFEDLLRRG